MGQPIVGGQGEETGKEEEEQRSERTHGHTEVI